jgi:hypothetical protein
MQSNLPISDALHELQPAASAALNRHELQLATQTSLPACLPNLLAVQAWQAQPEALHSVCSRRAH